MSFLKTGIKQSIETINKRVKKIKGLKRNEQTRKKMNNVWEVEFPSGKKEIVCDMKQFSKKFNLIGSCISNVASGKRKQHRGFKFKRLKLGSASRLKR